MLRLGAMLQSGASALAWAFFSLLPLARGEPPLIRGGPPLQAQAFLAPSSNAEIIKGISYGPVPTKDEGRGPPIDDFMAPDYEPLWGDSGRGDLGIIRKMGANTVRLYGNDPRQDHSKFLDTAQQHDIRVIPGMSNYPFTSSPDACSKNGWDCYKPLKAQFAQNLKRGFVKGAAYHPAISHIIIINEPDYKAPGLGQPTLFCRAVISAFDGMLDAEKEAGIDGSAVKFTATFSFGVCSSCSKYTHQPALGQMYDLRAAMLNPERVGYTPKNDLATAYKERFVQSFNTPSPANVVAQQFLKAYKLEFQEPFFIGEYHAPMTAQAEDMKAIMGVVNSNPDVFLGISYFEFQQAYNKGGSEMEFGMLGLGDMSIERFTAFGGVYDAWCLNGSIPDPHAKTPGATIAEAVIDAFGGAGVEWDKLCLFDPEKVPITKDGFKDISNQRRTDQMATFISRTVEHMGGLVNDKSALQTFAARFSGSGSFAQLTGELGGHPGWADWDTTSAACVADRSADAATLGQAMSYACGHLSSFDCKSLPTSCNDTTWTAADYIFSIFYSETESRITPNPLEICAFDGAAMYASRDVYDPENHGCVVNGDPATTAMTQEGYTAMLRGGADKVEGFIRRVLREQFDESVADRAALRGLARNTTATLPLGLRELELLLKSVPWTCGGASNRACPSGAGPLGTAIMVAVFIAAGVSLAVFLAVLVVRHVQKRRRQSQPLVAEH